MVKKKVSPDLLADQRRMQRVIEVLEREYPEAECSLYFETPFQLLIATMLSAQCTDERVNQVTPDLFAEFPDAQSMAQAELSQILHLIRSVNFYKNKAKAILKSSQILVEKYAGEVPASMDELIKLSGVGRKTANVVLGVGFQIPSLVVDTHVGRLTRRLGFSKLSDPVKLEQHLMKIVPEKNWIQYAHLLILHGRAVCTARRANCERCLIERFCPKVGVSAKEIEKSGVMVRHSDGA